MDRCADGATLNTRLVAKRCELRLDLNSDLHLDMVTLAGHRHLLLWWLTVNG